MILPLLALLQTTAPAAQEARFEACVDQAVSDPAGGIAAARGWGMEGGGFLARQCLGMAYAASANYAGGASAFEEAARLADTAGDARVANYWAQAGNAWLAAGDGARARVALDAAIARATLAGTALGEAHLDRARAIVASGGVRADARGDLDAALRLVPADPLAWLLSATLARQTGDLARARADIAQALSRGADDPSVQLEAGNIAAASGDEAGARGGWTRAATIAASGPVGAAARAALAQFEAGK